VLAGQPAHFTLAPCLPSYLQAALARLQAAGGDADAAEQARQLTERRLREHGWLEADGSVRCPGNGAWLIAARKGSQ